MTEASFFKDAERWRLALEAILAGYGAQHQSTFCRDLARAALGNQTTDDDYRQVRPKRTVMVPAKIIHMGRAKPLPYDPGNQTTKE